MSKWTLTRKTQATAKSVLHINNLREGWFKMKVDHCKKQGALMFDFEKHIVKLQVQIEIERHYKTFWRLADIFD